MRQSEDLDHEIFHTSDLESLLVAREEDYTKT